MSCVRLIRVAIGVAIVTTTAFAAESTQYSDYKFSPRDVMTYMSDPDHPGHPVIRQRVEEFDTPYSACKNQKLYLYQGIEKYLVFESKNPNGNKGDRLDKNGHYYKIIPQGFIRLQKPPCEDDNSWVPNADLATGAFWTDFYNRLKDYEDARTLALMAGEEKLLSIAEEKRLKPKVSECLSKIKTWPQPNPAIEPKLKSQSSCDEIVQFFVQKYLPDFAKFRKQVALAIDVAPGISYTRENLTSHLNTNLALPTAFWPSSSLHRLSQEEISDLEKIQLAWKSVRTTTQDSTETLKQKYRNESASSRQQAVQLGSKYPSFFSIASVNPTPEDIAKLVSRRAPLLDSGESKTNNAINALEKSGSTENMDEIFELTRNREFVERALLKNPELCAAAAGVDLRKAKLYDRIRAYSVGFLAVNMLAGRVLPKNIQKAAIGTFLTWDAFNLLSMAYDQWNLNRNFSEHLSKNEESVGVQQLIEANMEFLMNEGLLVAFAVPSGLELRKLMH
jgi:hypothetical protein